MGFLVWNLEDFAQGRNSPYITLGASIAVFLNQRRTLPHTDARSFRWLYEDAVSLGLV